ncbi:hypothetical protein [Clostridium sp. UBA1652]|uniref:hypothetical protein n=1 Tax=Clostridium sp. UBA1652 TaxID=1946348 RepID=UPI00257D385A|nr:hypothetical protein [Clostridium sp. UBA1652]
MIRSKKVITVLLSLMLGTSILIGCGKKESIEDSNKIESKEITSAEQLPTAETKVEYLGYKTSIEKKPEDFNNYKEICDFVDSFNKSLVDIDYTDESTFFDFRNFGSTDYVNSLSNVNNDNEIADIKDKKIQVQYIKTNIDSIVFNSYADTYFIDSTIFSYAKNNPSVSEQEKYYQSKLYLYITRENGKLTVLKYNGFSDVRAEEVPTSPVIYMLDSDKTKSNYVKEKNLDKFSDLDNAKKTTEEFFEVFYLMNSNNLNDRKNKLLKFASNDFIETINKLMATQENLMRKEEYVTEFKSIDYKVINYLQFNNSYVLSIDVTYTHNGSVVRTPFMINLIKEDDSWKIDKQTYIGENLPIT